MSEIEEIIKEKFGEELSGYVYTTYSDLVNFYKETWNEALDVAAENAEAIDGYNTGFSGSAASVDKQSILKLKK